MKNIFKMNKLKEGLRFKRDKQKMGAYRSQVEFLESSHWKQSVTIQNMALLSDSQGDLLILSQSG